MKLFIGVIVTLIVISSILTISAPVVSLADSVAIISLSPAEGTAGTAIAITGSGFTPNTAGNIWFDTNANNAKDEGEPSRAISATKDGELPNFTRLTVPKAPGGDYKVLADIPGGGITESSADFTITPGLSLSQKTGYSGTKVKVSGTGFTAEAAGYIWFDTDKNGIRDNGEPQAGITCDENGLIPSGSILTPPAGPGVYSIMADIPDGGVVEASAVFTYASTLILSPSPVTANLGSVVMDTVITITVSGGGFTPAAQGFIWFDYNNNGFADADESQADVTVNPDGSFSSGIVLQTPKLPPCTTYNVEADIPEDGSVDASAVLSVAETTTSVTVNKHNPYGEIIATKTVTWEWMKDHLPVIGDGKTVYYIQKGTAVNDTFDAVWDPQETDTDYDTLLEMGNAKGTDVKDLLELVGGASKCDSVLFTASDNWQVWFDHENIYSPDPRQGKVVLSWWNGANGGYVPDFYLGMRLYCLAETVNAAGQHIYGNWDMHETLPPSRWEYSPIGACTSRLSNKYVRYIDIYEPNIYPCDASGRIKTDFTPGETVYVKGLGLKTNTSYNLWIQPDGVQISPLDELGLRNGTYTLDSISDPSGTQESVTTNAKGDFTPTAVWKLDTAAGAPVKYDIVADNQAAGIVGTYDNEDSISNKGWEGFTAPSVKNSSSNTVSWIISGVIVAAVLIVAIFIIIKARRRKSRA